MTSRAHGKWRRPTLNPLTAPMVDFRARPPFKSFLPAFFRGAPVGMAEQAGLRSFMVPDPGPSAVERSMDLFFREMDSNGIDLAVVVGRQSPIYGNDAIVASEDIAELVAKHPDRFVGVGGVDSSDPVAALREAARCKRMGFVGIALENAIAVPPRHDDDRELAPVYAYCEEEELLVLITSSVIICADLSYGGFQRSSQHRLVMLLLTVAR